MGELAPLRPELVLVIGLTGLIAITRLMVTKPFEDKEPIGPRDGAVTPRSAEIAPYRDEFRPGHRSVLVL
jgi:hypothetical protein